MACVHLKDCHPNRIDVRVLRGKQFLELSSKSELFREQQLWRHPPDRASKCATSIGGPINRFIKNRGKSEVRQASAALRIYQDVGLVTSFSTITNYTTGQELTPLISPWRILCSCKYSNPVAAPTSCPDSQCDRSTLLSLHSRDVGDCNPGWP